MTQKSESYFSLKKYFLDNIYIYVNELRLVITLYEKMTKKWGISPGGTTPTCSEDWYPLEVSVSDQNFELFLSSSYVILNNVVKSTSLRFYFLLLVVFELHWPWFFVFRAEVL